MNDRICRSEGCKTEVASKTVDGSPRSPVRPQQPSFFSAPAPANGSRITSRFCKKHTCDHFFKQEGCEFKKTHYDSVCSVHAQCPIPGCLEGRGQYLELEQDSRGTPKYLRYDFCAQHTCSVLRCRLQRKRAPPGRLQWLFCEQHNCQADDCTSRRVDQDVNFCLEHKCIKCRTIVEGNHGLCSIHVKCEVRNCNEVKLRNGKEYLPLCVEHASCQTVGCRGLKFFNSLHCERHTCPERSCEISTGDHQLCDNHRCEVPSCENSKGWKRNRRDRERYCPLHTCRSKECQKDVGTKQLFCVKHECSDPRCKEEALLEQLCETHLKTKYEAVGRAKIKADMLELRQASGPKAHPNRDFYTEKDGYKGRGGSTFKSTDEERHSHGEESYGDKDEFDTSSDHRFEQESDGQSVHSWVRTS